MTRSDDSRRGADVPWKPAGPGLLPTLQCMGCGQRRVVAGSRGVGIRRRCAVCVAAKGAAA